MTTHILQVMMMIMMMMMMMTFLLQDDHYQYMLLTMTMTTAITFSKHQERQLPVLFLLLLASGIVFNNVIAGAIISASAATIGSIVAFSLAKINTPVRTKALQLLDDYPSLRGIDKVVAKDGLKAVITLRLAPILPIPIGLYNYIYDVSNVSVLSFAIGIFLGSLKPYFLDSYLGYTVDPSGIHDYLLLAALGISVLIGVFASQLASETWDTVLQEMEVEKQKTKLLSNITADDDTNNDGIIRQVLGVTVPDIYINMQVAFHQAENRLQQLVISEYEAKVRNYTSTTGILLRQQQQQQIPDSINPAKQIGSPELEHFNSGINLVDSLCDGFVLSPVLIKAFIKYSDPLYNEINDICTKIFNQMATTSSSTSSSNSDSTRLVKQQLKQQQQQSARTKPTINCLLSQ
jgi:uncharacterized membrane protein YdjX (TVP38/TMEM64 family)